MPYDLVLKGGEVIDPGWPLHQQADVAISKGKIAAVSPNIPTTEAIRTIDVSGKTVCPGLIDIHAHTFINAHDMGPQTDQRCSASGVTTLVDAGSSGSATFPGLRQYVADRSQVRLRCFVHLSALGLIHLQVGELMNMDYADPEGCARTIRENRDLAIGVKLRFSNNVVPDAAGTEPLRLARQAADMADVPLMVHITDALLPVPKILEFMKPGDIVTHCLHRYQYGIMGPEKKRDPAGSARGAESRSDFRLCASTCTLLFLSCGWHLIKASCLTPLLPICPYQVRHADRYLICRQRCQSF